MPSHPIPSHTDNAIFLRELAENLPATTRTPERVAFLRRLAQREEMLESFAQDAIAAWESYQQTRLHLTDTEADAWLARLEAGEDIPPPPCHRQ